MKFMLLIYHDEAIWDALTESERQEIYGEYRELIQELEPKRNLPGWRRVTAD